MSNIRICQGVHYKLFKNNPPFCPISLQLTIFQRMKQLLLFVPFRCMSAKMATMT